MKTSQLVGFAILAVAVHLAVNGGVVARGSDNNSEAVVVSVEPMSRTVNVMKKAMPPVPTFPKLAKKPNFVRGYVYGSNGKPLKGAQIGVRSSAGGGFYSGASAKTDEKGYYEIRAPWGAGSFYCAGYAVDYGEGRAAMGLYPADGEAEQFATANGTVENWVMLPYGIADRDGVQENPQYGGNYYGGSVVFGWHVDDDERYHDPKYLPLNSQWEITLAPEGPLVDGSPSRTIVLRKSVGTGVVTQLYVTNIPAASYKISAKLVGGGPLKVKEYGDQSFGLQPKEATGTANFLLRPGSANTNSATAHYGNWDRVSIQLERP